jgi:hypothetical protein
MSSIIGQRKHRQHSARAGLAHLLTYYPKDRSRTRTHVAVSISKARNYSKSIRFPLLLSVDAKLLAVDVSMSPSLRSPSSFTRWLNLEN